MQINIHTYQPAEALPGYFYLVDVTKASGEKNQYVVQIHHLPPKLQEMFTDQYHAHDIKNNFYLTDFFPLRKLHDDIDRFGKDKSMGYNLDELHEFLLVGIGGAVQHFVQNLHPHAIVAIPTRPGLGWLYDEIMRDYSACMGYNYNESYKEFSIYVLET
ncbi:hypothetical protein J2125_003938 [Erwinia toletana]|uniref:Uncharacterized protein n=1 Tax=Winslowiella toletana TaxID=92490 RepID=A0ABS4PDN2_9GAMM|nr:hypothetical protein [Winslowiella toletana]MBP2170746.1 hypothetical protein [Winslowiella toletana]